MREAKSRRYAQSPIWPHTSEWNRSHKLIVTPCYMKLAEILICWNLYKYIRFFVCEWHLNFPSYRPMLLVVRFYLFVRYWFCSIWKRASRILGPTGVQIQPLFIGQTLALISFIFDRTLTYCVCATQCVVVGLYRWSRWASAVFDHGCHINM